MGHDQADTRTGGAAAWLIGFVLVGALAAMIWSARTQGVWTDEIWSLWMSERGVPFSEALRERWMYDLHPPLFHAVNWVAGHFVEPDIFQRRLLNLGPLLYFAAIAGFLWRRTPRIRPFVLVFAAVLLTSRNALWYFPEHRSYFLVLCVGGALAAQLYDTFLQERDVELRADRAAATLLGVSILVSLNLHYISTVVIGAVLMAVAAAHALLRRPRIACFIVALTALSAVPLLAGLVGQMLTVGREAGDFWIKTSPLEAIRLLITTPGLAVASNAVAAACALVTAATALRGARQRGARAFGDEGSAAVWWFVGAATLGLVLASAFLAAVSLFKPILVPRYLIVVSAISIAILSAAAAPMIVRRRWILVLFCLNAALLIFVNSARPMNNPRWAATIGYIRSAVESCPETLVYGLDPGFVAGPQFGKSASIRTWGYRLEGRLHGFEVSILDANNGRPPLRLSEACPTLLWAEHANARIAVPLLFQTPVARTPEMQSRLAQSTVFRGQSGFVIRIPPGAQ